MKYLLQSLALLMALLAPAATHASYIQLADGVYQDGTTLYISSSVTSLDALQVNPTEIYCYATIPPSLFSNTFTGYDAALHVPAASMVSYFTTLYWYNFNNITGDAIEPQTVTLSETSVELEQDGTVSLSAIVTPSNATPSIVYWSSTNSSVATVSSTGMVTAVAAGECDIIATCVDKQAMCHVTVTPHRATVTLDQHEARLLPNHTMTLTATCTPPATNLAVTTSDQAVAIPRYVNGTIMVVGVGEGTATITVSTDDGWCHPDTCEVNVYTLLGDVNADGYIDVSDVTTLIARVLGNEVPGFNEPKADVNHDGVLDVTDVTMLIAYVLGSIDLNPPPEPATETFMVNGVSFTMVNVEGGTFTMGATAEQGSDAEDIEKPAHQVTLSSYFICETEVTQALWQAVMGSNPSYFTSANSYANNLNRPVENVSWEDCQSFIARLNELTGMKFRLPTEAEWEFAARGGNHSQGFKYSGSNNVNDVASFNGNTHVVATKAPNELGIFDMSGNVYEWCQDCWGDYNSDTQTNPIGGYLPDEFHIIRGGCWNDGELECRVSYRRLFFNERRDYILGLRLALDNDTSPKFRLSETVVTVWKGRSAVVDILNGNGDYTLVGETYYVTSTVCRNSLTVIGNTVGCTTVGLTDNTTNAQTCLNVIVKEPENVVTFIPGIPAGCNTSVTGPDEMTMGGITVNTSNGAFNAPQYRFGKNATTTITSTVGNITKIEFECTETNPATGFDENQGIVVDGYNGIWTGSAAEITLTSNVKQVRATKITFTVGGNGLADPSIKPASGTYYSPVEVTITCGTSGADIYYTTNGNEPSTSSTKYTAPFTLSTNTSVKAISAKDGKTSNVVTAEYVFECATPVANIAAFQNTADETMVTFTNPVNVLAQSGQRMFVKDNTGYALFYGTAGQTYKNGDVISAGFAGLKTTWDGEPELKDLAGFQPASGNSPIAAEYPFSAANVNHEHFGHFVAFKNATITKVENNYFLTDENGGQCAIYFDSMGVSSPTDLDAKYNIEAIVGSYGKNTVWQLLPTKCTPVGSDDPITETYDVNGVSFTMVSVEGGTFIMGASDDDPEAYDKEKPAHLVTLSGFSIGETEVSQALWQAVMGSNPSYYTSDLNRPVECVSWNDCQTFITKLNEMTGKTFRLPTEAEWEFAARGGMLSQGYKYSGSNDINEVAWYSDNSSEITVPVATKKANELGLYDMSGNVWEWCQDWYGNYGSDSQTNPTGPISGSSRVYRGGGWSDNARGCRVTGRGYYSSEDVALDLGLRLAL